jgi:hypothetical protein
MITMKRKAKIALCLPVALIIGAIATYSLASGGPIITELLAKSLNCRQMPCFLGLNSLTTGFDWDTLYVFAPEATQQEVESVLQTHAPPVDAGTIRFAFTNKGRLVHFEEEKTGLEHAHRDRVVFVLPKGKHFGEFPKETIFNVSLGESGTGEYQVLWDFCHLEQDGQAHTGACPLLE